MAMLSSPSGTVVGIEVGAPGTVPADHSSSPISEAVTLSYLSVADGTKCFQHVLNTLCLYYLVTWKIQSRNILRNMLMSENK